MNRYRIFHVRFSLFLITVFSLFLISGCVHKLPEDALQLPPDSLKIRQLQTRTFDTDDEKKILSASAAVLQDLGFNISESESKLGLIVASKQRTAVEGGQVAGVILLALLTRQVHHYDKAQTIRVCLVTRPVGEKSKSIAVRVTFQRVVVNTANRVTKNEAVIDEDIYREFFEKLSQSVFLEAHKI
jgi:hypothetical protein